jgi:PAS domain S-box-containing protein
VVFANSALARICGYEISELLSMKPEEVAGIVHPDDRARILQNMARRLEGGEAPATQSFRMLHRNGSTLVVETQSVAVDFEGSPAIQVSFEDVTAARAAEEKLNSTHQKMRNLAVHLLLAREEERRKVAQEIHDEFGQALAALKMDMHWLDKHVRGAAPDVAEKIKGMIRLSEQTIGMVQSLSSQLRPRMLDDLGLAPALDWLAGDFSRRTGISCTMDTDFPSALVGGNAATTLYRVVQEALSNVARHSQARQCTIRLHTSGGAIMLRIEDDGIGITPAQAAAAESYGIIGIHERVEGLGGSLSIVGSRESGSTLLVRIPLPGEGGLA